MIKNENFIGFTLSSESGVKISSFNPKTHEALPQSYFAASENELNLALKKAREAFPVYANLSMIKRADFLEQIANEIEDLGDELIQQAVLESGLPEARFIGERGRTTGQLRLFARELRDGNWVEASIDTAIKDRSPLPKPDIRQMLTAIGPIAIFTASNFPLAFSTAGGDTASALAAGCPVIIKAHESHLGVNALVSAAIVEAAIKTGMPDGVFSSLIGDAYKTGSQLVMHPDIKGVAFTGSFNGGKALYDIAQKRKDPIPVFAEMGSINPVIFLPSKLEKDLDELAALYAGSITMGVGQFCTNPGLLISRKSKALEKFKERLSAKLSAIPMHTMLNKGIESNFSKLRSAMLREAGVQSFVDKDSKNSPTLAFVSASDFIKNPSLHKEVFGPFSLLVECEDKKEMKEVIDQLEGQLTATIMADATDIESYKDLFPGLQDKVGRLIFNSTPTGVEVCHSMHHGGPFPATTDSRFTSVGTKAIKRFVRPICFQNAPEELLPEALKDSNPLGIYRLINGVLSSNSI
jgi:NADP-dependent aldehyde dehydrogenase